MRPLRPAEFPLDRCVTGPHAVRDGDGEHELVFRCELCGTVSTDPALRRGCWNCDGGVGWR
jgi:hypothetical protein